MLLLCKRFWHAHVRFADVLLVGTFERSSPSLERMPIEEFRELRMAAEELRTEIAIQLEIVRAVEDKLTTSAGAVYAVRNLPTKQIRDSLDKAFKEVVERRRAWRVALMHSCCLEEDMSLTEFARHFGFSRQYAQSLAADSRKAQLPD